MMVDNTRWKSKVDALIRLAEDQVGKPEGDVARQKLQQILEKYPQAAQVHEPLRQFTMGDVGFMHKRGISTDGRWTGANFHQAVQTMVADYRARIAAHEKQPELLDDAIVGIEAIVDGRHITT